MTLPPVYVGKRRSWLAAVVVCGLVQAACMLGLAGLMQRMLDAILAGNGSVSLPAFLGIMVGLGILGGLSRWLERYAAERLGQDYVHQLRVLMFAALARKSPEERTADGRGAVPLRFMTDLNAIRQWISMGQARLLVAIVLLVATLGYLATISLALSTVVLGVLALSAGASLLLGRYLERAILQSRQRRARLSNLMAERIANLSTVIGFGRFRSESQRMEKQSRDLGQAMTKRAFWVGSLRGTTELGIRLAMAAVFTLSLYQLDHGAATPGTILAAVSLVALLVAPLRDISRVNEYWTAARVARRKLAGFLAVATTPRTRRDRAINDMRGVIRLEKLRLQADHLPFSAELTPGSRVVVVGPNGAGKTSLLWTLAGIRRAAAGRARIDGRAAHRLDRPSLQQSVGIASPDLPLLKGTVQLNLRYRAPRATEAELEEVCAATGLTDRLGTWPELLQFRLQDEGSNLSDGERARLQLARAIIGQPKILLLDELDAHLDPAGRQLLRHVIANYPGTVIYTSHDTCTTQLAGIVWLITPRGIRLAAPSATVVTLKPAREVHS